MNNETTTRGGAGSPGTATPSAHDGRRVETFDIATFDGALREHFPTAQQIGLQGREHVWVIPAAADGAVGVIIRSTIAADGKSAPAGADSIRAWLGHIPDGEPYAPKVLGRWVTRRPGWAQRLCRVVEELLGLARHVRPCPVCGAWMKIAQDHAGLGAPGSLILYCTARTTKFRAIGAEFLRIPTRCNGRVLAEPVTISRANPIPDAGGVPDAAGSPGDAVTQ